MQFFFTDLHWCSLIILKKNYQYATRYSHSFPIRCATITFINYVWHIPTHTQTHSAALLERNVDVGCVCVCVTWDSINRHASRKIGYIWRKLYYSASWVIFPNDSWDEVGVRVVFELWCALMLFYMCVEYIFHTKGKSSRMCAELSGFCALMELCGICL